MKQLKYLAFLAFYVSLLIPRFLQGQSGALGNGYNAGSILPALTYNGYLPQAYAPASFTLYGYDATGLTPGAALYVSGGTTTGAKGTYCSVTVGGGAPSATGRLYLTALNTVAASSAISFAAVGSQVGAGYASAPTSGTLGSGTATCSGTATIASTLGAYAAFAVDGAGNIQAGSVNQGAATPATCIAGQIFTTVITGSAVPYYCSAANTWTVLGGGSGTFVALSGDATSTASGGATTVKGINGTLLSSLATGVLKNTTTTGVPSIATYADIVALWSSCAGTQYLGYDGTCHTAAGAVASVANSDGTLTISPTTGSVVASLNLAHSNTWTAQQLFPASTTGAAPINLGQGTAPTSPNNGDLWTTSVGLYAHYGGATVGPFGAGGGTPGGSSGQVQFNNSGAFGGFTFSQDVTVNTATGAATTVGINGVPLCNGYTPTNSQFVQYTTASTPNPCYRPATPTGAGTVNSGTANQFAWYSSTGAAVSGNANATVDSSGDAAFSGTVSMGIGSYTLLKYFSTTAATIAALTPSSYTGYYAYINDQSVCGSTTGGGSLLGWLYSTGSAWVAGQNCGTVTSFSAGNLSPLFTASVATSTVTPALTFSLSNAAQNSVFAGPATGGAGAPSYQTAPTISAANMTSFPASLAVSGANGNITSLTGLTTPLSVAQGGTGAATAAQNSVLAGPATGGAGAPSFQTAPTISAANMTNFPGGLGVANATLAVSGGTQGANSCSSSATVTMTGLTTSMIVLPGYSASPAALTGWGSTGGMVLQMWPSASNTASYILCNQTANSITYSAITFNVGAR